MCYILPTGAYTLTPHLAAHTHTHTTTQCEMAGGMFKGQPSTSDGADPYLLVYHCLNNTGSYAIGISSKNGIQSFLSLASSRTPHTHHTLSHPTPPPPTCVRILLLTLLLTPHPHTHSRHPPHGPVVSAAGSRARPQRQHLAGSVGPRQRRVLQHDAEPRGCQRPRRRAVARVVRGRHGAGQRRYVDEKRGEEGITFLL